MVGSFIVSKTKQTNRKKNRHVFLPKLLPSPSRMCVTREAFTVDLPCALIINQLPIYSSASTTSITRRCQEETGPGYGELC